MAVVEQGVIMAIIYVLRPIPIMLSMFIHIQLYFGILQVQKISFMMLNIILKYFLIGVHLAGFGMQFPYKISENYTSTLLL